MLQSPVQPSEPSFSASGPETKTGKAVSRTSPFAYFIAIAFGLFSGRVNQKVADPLLTSLCVVSFSMIMGVWKKERPWRWLMLVWIPVPIVLAYYQFVARWPHTRGQIYGALLQVLAASAGAHGGHFMREMIDNVFLKQDDE